MMCDDFENFEPRKLDNRLIIKDNYSTLVVKQMNFVWLAIDLSSCLRFPRRRRVRLVGLRWVTLKLWNWSIKLMIVLINCCYYLNCKWKEAFWLEFGCEILKLGNVVMGSNFDYSLRLLNFLTNILAEL